MRRRDFLASSAAGVLAFGWRRRVAETQQLLYVGTYTDDGRSGGVYLLHMNATTGALRVGGSADVGKNPSFVAIHPNGRVLYAVNEVEELDGKKTGALTSCSIARDTGALTVLNRQTTDGGAPCYVA